MSTFTLKPDGSSDEGSLRPSGYEGLAGEVLLANALWFVRIRWGVVVAIAVLGAFSHAVPSDVFASMGLLPPQVWPWVLAIVLAVFNLITIRWVKQIAGASRSAVMANLWFQIFTDLMVLTVMVYFVGPRDTVIAFMYLFHIALACIFFRRRNSFVVMAGSAVLYLITVLVVALQLLPSRSILLPGKVNVPDFMVAGPTVLVFVVVWYLTSALSDAVRHRDHELHVANAQLCHADESKNQQMLRVTHDLKAPFSGIESNIQVLRVLHWESIPDAVREIVDKIDMRASMLRSRIGDILMLGSLRTITTDPDTRNEHAPLHSVLQSVIDETGGLRRQHNVTVALIGLNPVVYGDLGQLKVLFANLISNAITYSRDDCRVEVAVSAGPPLMVRISDQGIGIAADALPHIFEDFYRSRNAAKYNVKSTGLGLAIVRQIASNLGLILKVESEEGEGTTFKVEFPPAMLEERDPGHRKMAGDQSR